MLAVLKEFRDKLDEIMLKCMHDRIALYGYDSYTGRFLKWYAEYYHGIEVDWLISEDMSVGRGYDREIFRPSVFDFAYKDIKNAILWLAKPLTKDIKMNSGGGYSHNNERPEKWGYKKNKTYFDFYEAIYGEDAYASADIQADAFHRKKTGRRDIQFLEWLEWKYGCNFLVPISKEDFEVVDENGHRYSCSTQKEIFPMLDHCHVHPSENDGIFDFGCGKGGAMVTFLDYGFSKVGGVEYETKTWYVAKDNFSALGIDGVELIRGDARAVTSNLDGYNWFYFFFPFDREVFEIVINNIKESYLRHKRKIHLIYFTAMKHDFIEQTGIFRLTNQFTVDSRQRVVGIFESCE